MKKPVKIILIILGIIILLPILTAVALIIILKGVSVQTDDSAAFIKQAPMAAEERFAFDSSDKELSINLDKADIYWYLNELKGTDLAGVLSQATGSSGLTVNSCGLILEDGNIGLTIDASFGILSLKGTLGCELEVIGDEFVLMPKTANIIGLELPIEKLVQLVAGDTGTLELKVSFTPTLLTGINSISASDGILTIKGPVNTEIIEKSADTLISDLEAEWYSFLCDNSGYGANIVCKSYGHPASGVKLFYEYLEESPEDFIVILNQVLTYMDVSAMNKVYPGDTNCRFFVRLGGYSEKQDYADAQQLAREQKNDRKEKIESLMEYLTWDYQAYAFGMYGGKIYFNGEEFSWAGYLGEYAEDYEFLTAEAVLGIIDYAAARNDENPHLEWISDGAENFSAAVDMTREYPLAIILRGLDGNYRVIYASKESYVSGGETTYHLVVNVIDAGDGAEDLFNLPDKVPVLVK